MLGLDSHEDTVMYKIHLLLPKAVKHWTLDVANIIKELFYLTDFFWHIVCSVIDH